MGIVVGVIESIDLILLWQWHFPPVHWCLYLTSMETKGSNRDPHLVKLRNHIICRSKNVVYIVFFLFSYFHFMRCELMQTFSTGRVNARHFSNQKFPPGKLQHKVNKFNKAIVNT